MATSASETDAAPPPWLDRSRYPFRSRWADLPEGRMHYVDEGEGRPIVFLHGNPTWSFLYRHLIDDLSDDYRCIAPDQLGFGLSERPREFSYRPADLARAFERFASRFDLDGAVLVVHDWGGPIGLDYAVRHPDEVDVVVAMNTWMWPRNRLRDRVVARVVGTRTWERLVLRRNAFARAAVTPVAMGAAARGRIGDARAIRRHYLRPLATPEDRIATATLPREVTGSSEWLGRLWERRDALAGTSVLLLWGRRDPIHGSMLGRWRETFLDASWVVYDRAGHFVPEAVGPDLARPIREFLRGR